MNYKEYTIENRKLKLENKKLKDASMKDIIYIHDIEKQNTELVRENYHLTKKLERLEQQNKMEKDNEIKQD